MSQDALAPVLALLVILILVIWSRRIWVLVGCPDGAWWALYRADHRANASQ